MKPTGARTAVCCLLYLSLLFLIGCAFPSASGESFTKPLTDEQIEYFQTIALGVEFGDSERRIHKWTEDLRIKVLGEPTAEDLRTLDEVISELNTLQGQVNLESIDSDANVKITFAPESEFSQLDPNYEPINYGFFWVTWNAAGEIDSARILISTDEITQEERSHLIREELTQSLGLMRDSLKHPDSIFYAIRSKVDEYADIDKAIIGLLYSSAIEPDMTPEQVRETLQHLAQPSTDASEP